MKFEEALAAMREGKKVRHKQWHEDIYFYMDSGEVKAHDTPPNLSCAHIGSDDWQIYEEPKWEPEGGDWVIEDDGSVNEYKNISNYADDFGTTRKTSEQAKAARDKMRVYNRLLAYVDECSKDGDVAEWVVQESFKGFKKVYIGLQANIVGSVKMSERVADQLCKDINSGRVVL